jgi:hypothetical protein
LAAPLCATAQWSLPASGCNIRYGYDAAGNRISRYWYCWTAMAEAPPDDLLQPDSLVEAATPTAMEEQRPMAEVQLQVYPNPAHHELYIDLSGPIAEATYNVYDSDGRNLLNGRVIGTNQLLDTSTLKPGVYHLSIVRQEESLIAAFVVE